MEMKEYNWRFSKENIKGFDKHIKSSVPYYDIFHQSLASVSKFFARRGSEIIDVGTSTGNFIHLLKNNIHRDCSFIGIDVEEGMIEECQKRYNREIDFLHIDCVDFDYSNASVVGLVLVLQFIDKHKRIKFLEQLYRELKEDSVLLIIERVRSDNPVMNDVFNDLYYDFKMEMGLTEKEILNKNLSLRGVMKPLTLKENFEMLNNIGFKTEICAKFNNFASMVAIK